ncbi:hypothetical protein Q1M64_21830 [Sinorhizobium meliloti]|nr:hypothetical protein Q1M65_21045 [Sinorhizobium meliloti]WKL38223.1 hypothetical protein Q1M62_20635 [Sinorhizobium meliloti]WKL41947.1 hypothetical protein Q1M64_21830 [Sinorhizobium meliloti]
MGTPIVGSRGWSRCFLADSRQNQCAGIRESAGTSTQCALAEQWVQPSMSSSSKLRNVTAVAGMGIRSMNCSDPAAEPFAIEI